MKRSAVAVCLVVVLVFAAQAQNHAQQSLTTANAPLFIRATAIDELRTWDTYVSDRTRSGELALRSVQRDPALPSRTVERFAQFHRGVRIWGADVIRDSDNGVAQSVFGTLAGDITLSVAPALSASEAATTLRRLGGNDVTLLIAPELVVLPLYDSTYALAYTGVVASDADVVRIFLDAQDGHELLRYTELQRDAAVGTGTGVLGDTKKLSVDANGGTYVAYDRHRPPVIETFDMRGNLTRTKLLERGLLPYTVADLASDADNVWTDPAVVDAHAHVSWTYDYYYKRFGRSGLDGRDGPIDIVVNAVSQQSALTLTGSDINYAVNANWCGSCGPGGRGRMFFGNGIPSGVTLGGQTYTYLSGGLDVAAHELTHAVTSATSNLIYNGESGALNEAFSDMMGKSVEFFYHPSGTAAGQADYVIGKDVIRSARAGIPSGIRSMANPDAYGAPNHYVAYQHQSTDGDGVHTNSSIPNHAFYLAIEGGTNRTSAISVQGVGNAGREQIEKVFYRAFTLLMPAAGTFVTARTTTIQAARDLYGAGSAAERAIAQAWNAVGVPDPSSILTLSGTLRATDWVTYPVTMSSTGILQANLVWNSPRTTDMDVYLTPVGCSFVYSSCVLAYSYSPDALETIGRRVRSGEQFWLTVHNYAGATTPFTVQLWTAPVGGITTLSTAAANIESPPVRGTASFEKKGADR